jgi:putative solute:sodium symporter small subunit
LVREVEGAGPATKASVRLPVVALLLWAAFAFIIPRFAQALNLFDVLAFPLGFFMVAQGSLIAFVIIAVFAARRRSRIPSRSSANEQGMSHGAN